MADYFRRPWENRESYAAHSPLTFADRVTTPLLLQHGEPDPRTPIAGALKFYRALKAFGKTVEFDIYPRGSHVQYEPQLQRESMQRNLDWFRRWITPLSDQADATRSRTLTPVDRRRQRPRFRRHIHHPLHRFGVPTPNRCLFRGEVEQEKGKFLYLPKPSYPARQAQPIFGSNTHISSNTHIRR